MASTPTLAPQVRRLREQHRRQPGLDVRQLGRQRVYRDDSQPACRVGAGASLQLAQQRLRVQRPAADHRPALDVGVRGLGAHHRRARLLGRLDV